MNIIEKYVRDNFYTEELINNVINGNGIITCKVTNNKTALQVGKDYTKSMR
jgi:hypothetical protein